MDYAIEMCCEAKINIMILKPLYSFHCTECLFPSKHNPISTLFVFAAWIRAAAIIYCLCPFSNNITIFNKEVTVMEVDCATGRWY
uniref:Uncharacterized protein n=1 Tax=Onchocerca volvulus TaxID=6282 RepID=A0A8R1Y1I8_ONCVO